MAELTPGSEFAGYTIEDIAGRGGMGVVYRARQHRPSRLVALKVIAPDLANDADFRARFERESDTAAAIEHPNVIPVYEVNDVDGLLFITMRFVEGTDLRALIADHGRLEPELAADIVTQIGAALDAAHGRGLVHRDIKPANVLIAGKPGSYHAYLTDFGLTKSTQAESGMTKTGMFVGTLDYIAPEQLMGGPLDARADVYALGCVLYQALTGEVPYPAESGMAKMYAHGNQPPPVPSAKVPGLPPQFDEVVARAMAKDPNDRYLSAGDLGRAAKAAAQAQSLSRAERSVATGEAAPADATAVAPRGGAGETAAGATAAGATAAAAGPTAAAPAPTTAGSAPPAPGGGGSRKRLLAIGGAVLALAVIAVVAVLALGGGSDEKRLSKAEYEDQVSQAFLDVSSTTSNIDLPSQLSNVGDERLKIASDLGKVEAAFKQADAKIDKLSPPSDVEDLHKDTVAAIEQLGSDIGTAQAAAETNDSSGYAAAVKQFSTDSDKLSQIGVQFRQRGYARLGASPGNETGRALTGEERNVADAVTNAQRGFREPDVELYCLSRTPAYMGKVYGGGYPFATCKRAGASGLKAEIPDVLKGGDLNITGVTIDQGGKGTRATVSATGDNGAKVTAVVRRNPPSDDVWRVDSFATG
jgi:protein kinase-like protein